MVQDDGYGRDRYMRRRRSKNFVKLSGKRTVTGLYSGEHAHSMSVTDGEPIQAKLSGTTDRDKGGFVRLCLCLYF